MKNNIQNKVQKNRIRIKYIIPAGLMLLLITPVFIFILLSQNPKPDPASENIIREIAAAQLNKDPNDLKDEDFAKITGLDLGGRSLNDIRFLKKIKNLRGLSIIYNSNSVANIPIWKKKLEEIGILKIEKLNIIDLNPIKKLDSLNRLDLTGTRVKNIKSLSELKYLTYLNLRQTNISDIRKLSSLRNLRWLNIRDTDVKEIIIVSNFIHLREFDIAGTMVYDLEPLKKLKNLKALDISNCPNIVYEQIEELQKALPDLKIIR